ncbi:MAG: DUF1732 domain-containing protein [Candidatus Omnitrophica bacterium]|nr:DUF1732 domain-containing protein [Candidatus Omnitrophota bacterium]
MIKGMTGFGTASFSFKSRNYTVSIRSVNHKFLDYSLSLPNGLFVLEAKIKKELSGFLSRGRITVQMVMPEACDREPLLNKKLLFKYYNLINNISKTLRIQKDISVSDMLDLPDVISFKKTDRYYSSQFLSLFNKALKQALRALLVLRKKEGSAIHAELINGIKKIEQKLKLIKERLISIIEEQKTKLSHDELKEFLTDYNIEEEIVRLEFHVKTFKNTLAEKGPVGKILDFITQEMQREVNTLGAKFRDAKASYSSVIIKDEIEKMREQLQNVE